MKLSKLCLLPIATVGMLAGCNKKNSGGAVTLTIWEDSSNIAVVQKLARDFVRDYQATYVNAPSISIKIIEHKEASAISDLASGIAESGEGPDIAAVTSDTIASGVSNSLLAEAMFSDAVKAKMTADAVNAVTVSDSAGDRVFGYPITAESCTVMYDKRLLSETDLANFDNLLASGKKLGITLSGDNAGFYTYGLYTDSVLFGDEGLDPTDVDIATEQTISNVTRFYGEYLSCFLDSTPEQAYNYVGNQIAGFVTTPFMLATMKEKLGENFGIAKLPKMYDGAGSYINLRPFSGYKAYIVNRYSPNGAIAHALCNYITDYAAQAYRLSEKGYLPACPLDATEDIEYLIENSEEATVFADSLEDSIRMPSIPQIYNFWSKMNIACGNFKARGSAITESYVESQLQDVTDALLGK